MAYGNEMEVSSLANRRSRSQYRVEMEENKRKKQDRILNILIAIVSILIVIKFIFILTENNETVEKKLDNQKEEQALDDKPTEKEQDKNEQIGKETESEENPVEQEDVNITKVENDEFVEEVIEDPNWTVIPTNQTGTHVSSFEKGNIDYEEKLQAIRSAVQLEEDNIIYWSVRNNGSPDTAISIISSKDKSEKYRVSIQWIENEGWKPVKVEKLKKLEGLI